MYPKQKWRWVQLRSKPGKSLGQMSFWKFLRKLENEYEFEKQLSLTTDKIDKLAKKISRKLNLVPESKSASSYSAVSADYWKLLTQGVNNRRLLQKFQSFESLACDEKPELHGLKNNVLVDTSDVTGSPENSKFKKAIQCLVSTRFYRIRLSTQIHSKWMKKFCKILFRRLNTTKNCAWTPVHLGNYCQSSLTLLLIRRSTNKKTPTWRCLYTVYSKEAALIFNFFKSHCKNLL